MNQQATIPVSRVYPVSRRVLGNLRKLFVSRTAAANALQQMLHAIGRGGDVSFKVQFRDAEEIQARGELAAQEMAGAVESAYGGLLLAGLIAQMQTDLSVPHVRRQQNLSDCRVTDSGIGELIGDDLAELFAECFRDTLVAVAIHCEPPILSVRPL